MDFKGMFVCFLPCLKALKGLRCFSLLASLATQPNETERP